MNRNPHKEYQDKYFKELGAYLKAKREHCGLEQKDVAKALNCSRFTISRRESGEASPNLFKIGMHLYALNSSLTTWERERLTIPIPRNFASKKERSTMKDFIDKYGAYIGIILIFIALGLFIWNSINKSTELVKVPIATGHKVAKAGSQLAHTGEKVDKGASIVAPLSSFIEKQHSQLQKKREGGTTFGQSIAKSIDKHYAAHVLPIPQDIQSIYKMQHKTPVSLVSHKMCSVTKKSLLYNRIKKIPDNKTIAKAHRFAQEMNRTKSKQLWGKFFACLAMTESLTTAPSNGVKIYHDKLQKNPASQTNIGVYQFSPDYNGNIRPCIEDWRQQFPQRKVMKGGLKTMTALLASSNQDFNIFCGVNKIVQTFAVQIDGLKRSCVTLHIKSGYAYNHFGPLMNSTGANMASLYNCIYPEEK